MKGRRYTYEYYVRDSEGGMIRLGMGTVDGSLETEEERMKFGIRLGIGGWNYVVCGGLGMYKEEGPGYKAVEVLVFAKDDVGCRLALMLVEGSGDAEAPKIQGYVYRAEYMREIMAAAGAAPEVLDGGTFEEKFADSVTDNMADKMVEYMVGVSHLVDAHSKAELLEMAGDDGDKKMKKNELALIILRNKDK